MIKKFSFQFDELIINRQELSETFGFGDILPEPFSRYLDDALKFASELKDIHAVYRVVDSFQFSENNSKLIAENIEFNIGKTIRKELKNSEHIAFFICSAGETISQKSKTLMAGEDPGLGFVYDTMGSFIAEAVGDKIQEDLKIEVQNNKENITNRYSPGYCKWSVIDQHKLFSLFPDNTHQVSLTPSALMHPVKSISGIIGIGKDVNFRDYACELCNSTACVYRK